MNVLNRTEEVIRHRLCLRCLGKGHRQSDRSQSQLCRKDGCQAYHHRLLHGAPRLADVASRMRRGLTPIRQNVERVDVGLASRRTSNEVICAVVPVRIRGNGRQVRSFALLDSGSEVSLISDRLARQTGLSGPLHCLQLRTVTGETSVAARRTTCEISSLDGASRFQLKQALVVPQLQLGTRTMPVSMMKKQWYHLKNIRFPAATLDRVEMFIGMDVPLAHHYREGKVGPNTQTCPIGVLTPFGWTIVGRVPKVLKGSDHLEEDRWVRRHVMGGSGSFEELMERFVDADPLTSPIVPGRVTTDERVVLDILKSTTRFDGERHEISLLWKSAGIELPCNRASAMKRFFTNERRLVKDIYVARKYPETVLQYIRDGHAKRIAQDDLGTKGRTW
ncbi:hypothetical protein M514_26365 [Trichuris suis]|uniref:Peptidase A2 domain-containing protein n=1 Tax=Trichuris suis TaxID=68888 RepID=A0A085MW73_9BILA|nr:hypothetical protein M514_26365 [Trichuris suis]